MEETQFMDRSLTAALFFVAVALSGCSASNDPANPPSSNANEAETVLFAPTPDTDAFYAAPDPLPDVSAGTILKSRSITFAPQFGIPKDNPAWQLQFLSHDVNGRPIAAIATVVKPLTPAAGTMPLLAYQFAEDALASRCAPSHSLAGSMDDPVSQQEAGNALQGLDLGWTLVFPDHEGSYSEYAAGRIAGQITLDSIRAALSFQELGLLADTPVAMWGYSGGAVATAWAASLQHSYAPELNIVAVASGGTPADLIGIAKNADTNPVTNSLFFNLVLSAVFGINRAYPDLITPVLNDQGKAAAEAMKDGCLGSTDGTAPIPKGHFADYSTTPDPLNSAGAQDVAPLITLPQPGEAPVADTFVYHSSQDELIPVAGVDAMVSAWCGAGSHVSYYRPSGGGHAVFSLTTPSTALAYLIGRLSNSPVDVVPDGTQTCN
jgi:hypothetical protein